MASCAESEGEHKSLLEYVSIKEQEEVMELIGALFIWVRDFNTLSPLRGTRMKIIMKMLWRK